MKLQQFAHSFHLGQNIDVLDSAKKWVNGQVVFIRGHELYIHYSGYSPKFDEYISMHSDRILTQWEPGKELKVNNRVDAFHPMAGWLEARVLEIPQQDAERPSKIKVHYFNYHPKYDRWIDPNQPSLIDLIGARSKAYGIGKSRLRTKTKAMTYSELAKKILQLKVKNMVEELSKEDYVVHNTEGDGNCLFRAISHQLYGQEDYHGDIRLLCMNYIKGEQAFFQNYVTQDIDSYIRQKSKLGVWGDDVQIQALSQIYGRPIEIYATSSRPLRTFHEDNQHQIQPLRLAYIGYSHYNSIKRRGEQNAGLLQTPFGQYEAIFAAAYQSPQYQGNLLHYRNFFARTNGIDVALEENVNSAEQGIDDPGISQEIMQIQSKQISQVLKISEAESILGQIQQSEMREIKLKQQQQLLQEELRRIEEEEIRRIQEAELQVVKEMSKKVKRDSAVQRPYWFTDLLAQGFQEQEILFAIEITGSDPDLVQNFLLDNM